MHNAADTQKRLDLSRHGLALVVVLSLAAPFLLKGFWVFQLSMILDYSIAVLSLVLLTGLNGQISLGNGAFFALGSYGTAILVVHFAISYAIAVPISVLACLVVGYGIGRPAVRLTGLYLALATFSLALVVPQLLKNKLLDRWTGGFQGLMLDPPSHPKFLRLSDDQWLYFVCLAGTAVSMILVRNLIAGRYGRALEAVRDHPLAAAAMGVDPTRVRAQVFAISALLAGFAGSLYAMLIQFVSPDGFNFFLSISLMVGAVVGGLTSVWGGLAGAAFIVFIPNVSEGISKTLPWTVYGVLLIVVVYLAPNGLVGLIARISKGADLRGRGAPRLPAFATRSQITKWRKRT